MTPSNKLIAIDADGVLVDYNTAYASLWERAFGEKPQLARPDGYHAVDRYRLPQLNPEALAYFEALRDEEFWATVPLIPGASEACEALRERGFQLVCVTALHSRFKSARSRCLAPLGFSFDEVYTTSNVSTVIGMSPKAPLLNQLAPLYFVDDYFPYFSGVARGIQRVLVHRDRYNSPNNSEDARTGTDLHVDSLWDFSQLPSL